MSENQTKPVNNHMGTKFLAFIIGLVLATVKTLLIFFTVNNLTISDYYGIALAWAFFVIVVPLIVFLAEIIWRYFHAYSEKFPMAQWTGLDNTMRAQLQV
jgi:heme/copper-type cytochrome/quinol oxidase subunit 4